ncbi:hypothetical protein DACRYDRAFT_103887 [Dacryopinax primogenitus]|uniref:Uncharacterized protein n=1 Tax=Dacryopinax primogenitus (strain DJM 731) TaxID=1858805 RepID=M5G567_DACPD|nr:uncharacterized protein DACRYDRAFT_103887 [Dacryopinax primogenitus]EJU05401.1 hypothetical protein DACRYDRAFT_103887 [Dacryopinax primogenitus]
MADSLALDVATLAGFFCSALLYGVFLVLLVIAFYVLIYKRKTQRPNYILLAGSCGMFVLSTFTLAFTYARAQKGFIYLRDENGGPIAYFEQINSLEEVIYRCWVVWTESYWIIAFPCFLWVASIVVDCMMIVTMAEMNPAESIFVINLGKWITAVLSLTLTQNIIVLTLIVYRIWKVNTSIGRTSTSSLRPIIAVLLESGIMYVTTLFLFLVTYLAGSNSQFIMVDILNPIIGIAFTVLIVRVGLGATRSQMDSTYFRSQHTGGSHGLGPIAISVNRNVHPDEAMLDEDHSGYKLGSDAELAESVQGQSEVA